MDITYTTTTTVASTELLVVDGVEQSVNKKEIKYTPDQPGLTAKSWFIGEHIEGTIAFINKERFFLMKILREWLVEAGYSLSSHTVIDQGTGSAKIIEKGKILDDSIIESWTKPFDETKLPAKDAETI